MKQIKITHTERPIGFGKVQKHEYEGVVCQKPLSKDKGLVSRLHRNSAYLERRAALVSTPDTSGHS